MSGIIRLYGETSGYSELSVPANAGDQVFVLPEVGGTLMVEGGPSDLWDRTGTTLSPANAGDSVDLGSGNILLNSDGSASFTGNITAGNVSDIKFKENITIANPQLDDVVALGSQLKNWDWKDEAPLNDEIKSKRFLGLIAQEAEKVCPGITYEVGAGDDSYKAISHDILVMKLLGAVAELTARVQQLEDN